MTGTVALILVVIATVSSYDSMLSNYVGPFGLDVPRRVELLPATVGAASALGWPVFMAVWLTLTTIQIRAHVPIEIASLGSIAGLALFVSAAYSSERFVSDAVLPFTLVLALVWATTLGVYLSTARPVTATA